MWSNFQQIISYCLGLCTQNLGLKYVDLECSPKRGSDKKKHPKESKLYLTAWTPIWIEALRQVDLEPNGKRGANRTRALVSFYWSSWSLHPKEPPNQISHNSTRVDPIRLSPIWKKSDRIPESSALQYIKIIFPKTTKATNAHDWGYKLVCHTQR